MATLQTLVDGVYADLADEAKKVFSQLQVESFVRTAIADLNRVAPQEIVEDLVIPVDAKGVITAFSYTLLSELIYSVEMYRDSDGWSEVIEPPEPGQTGASGWVFRRTPTGGVIEFPRWWLVQFNPSLGGIKVRGYAPRPMPYPATPSPTVSISEEEEYSVRLFAKAIGFDLLTHDRALFAQWQGQTNNTDVSPTQITQMASIAARDADRHRGLIRVIRRYG